MPSPGIIRSVHNLKIRLRSHLARWLVGRAFALHHHSTLQTVRDVIGAEDLLQMQQNSQRRARWLSGHTHRFDADARS